jgi:glutamate synthase (NADPH/NADH) small chain
MGKPTGFKEYPRQTPARRPVPLRILDWNEVYTDFPDDKLRTQAARCMDCGIPFCHNGCPVGNIIPDWNDLVYRNRWREAMETLLKTNNFPEFTGRVCPAPCEEACVLGINEKPVTIKLIEQNIIEHAFEQGWMKPQPPETRTGKKVAVVGSGPAGLACAAQLNKAGHLVTVFERSDRVGGLLMYGIPNFKLEKRIVDRRVKLLEAEGITFQTSANVGFNVPVEQLRQEFDAIVLCGGSTLGRDLNVPGRDLRGIHLAMEYLPQQNKRNMGDEVPNQITAKGKHVVILGGGDTGADCLGTAHRQGAKSVHQFELLPRPPEGRTPDMP